MKNNNVEVQGRIEPLMPEWENLARRTNANPFLWPGWTRAWWQAYGTGQLQIFTVYQNSRLAGVLPLHRFRGVLASPTNVETMEFGFLTANEVAARQLLHVLFSQKARRIDLSLLRSTDPEVALVPATADVAGYQIYTHSIQGSPFVAVSETTWDAFESGLSKNHRKALRRRQRRLEEKGRLRLEVFDGKENLNELLEEGFRVEGLAWKDAYGTSINARPATRRFYTEVAQWASKRGWLRLTFLRLNGRTLAFSYSLEYNKICYGLKSGYDPAYREYAPGTVMHHLIFARAFSEGITTYNLLGGLEPWKQEWTSTNRELLDMYMFAPTTLGFLERGVFVGRRSAYKLARDVAQSSLFPDRGRRLLERGSLMYHRALARKQTS